MLALLTAQAALATQPLKQPLPIDPTHWITIEDYPIEALRNYWDGRVGYSATINSQGLVSDCAVTRSSGHTVLDVATCDLIKSRAHFTPASNQNGVATAGQYASSVGWKIPDRGPADLVASSGRIEFEVDTQGLVHDCKSTIPEGNWPNLGDLCSHFLTVSNIAPLQFNRASDGLPRHVIIQVEMTIK